MSREKWIPDIGIIALELKDKDLKPIQQSFLAETTKIDEIY